jgi:glyoxylase I family protein
MGEHPSMAAVALHHLALRTHDVARLARFYREVVGLMDRPGGTPGRSVWLALGDGIVMIEAADLDETPVAAGTKELVAFRVGAREMGAVRLRLQEAHVAVEAETRFTVYARDPDGRRIAFSHYPEEPASTESPA